MSESLLPRQFGEEKDRKSDGEKELKGKICEENLAELVIFWRANIRRCIFRLDWVSEQRSHCKCNQLA